MKLFLSIVGCAAAASAVSLILQYLFDPRPAFELAGTALFFFGIAACVYADRGDPLASPRQVVLAPFAFIAFCILLAVAGVLTAPVSPVLAVMLISPMGLGYYPSGPDAPFVYGAIVWTISVMVLIAAAIAVGAALRRRRADPASAA